jgi:hypothetical protein
MVCHKETYEKLLNEQKIESIGFKLNGSDKDEGEEEDEILNESIKGKIK